MPTLTATPFLTEGYVLVKGDWTDTTNSNAGFVAVYRVNEDTGEEVLLRPYTAYNSSGCQMLHCGKTLFWDTEAPLNTPIHYRGVPCFPVTTGSRQPIGYDTFTRVNGATWNTSDSGDAWTFQGSGTRSVDGDEGVMTLAAANTNQREFLTVPNFAALGDGVITARARLAVTPTGASLSFGLVGRYTDVNNRYSFDVTVSTANALTATITRVVGGVQTVLSTASMPYTHAPNTVYNMTATLSGSFLAFKAWPVTTVEPVFSQVSASDATFGNTVPLNPGMLSNALVGNTNVPVDFFYEQFVVYATGATSASIISATVELDTEAIFLKSPLHPCSDMTLVSCGGARIFECEDPNVRQIIFQSMSEEGFEPNTVNLAPVNRRRVIPVNRERRDIDATLTLVTRTFNDRDAVREANRPGDPLLFQAPAAYGIADRYMSVGRVVEARGLPDHKIQPRLISLPHVVVDRPEGAADGVCGARFQDLCDIYTSWNAISLAGLTWEDLLEGDAGATAPGRPPVSAQRTWQDVLDDFATWGTVNDGIRTWQGVRDGA